MALTPRDRKILWAVHQHRYLSCEHIRQLFFPGKPGGQAQRRLRLLWDNRYLDRYYRPWAYDGTRESCWRVSAPYYTLAEKGAEIIWDDSTLDWDQIPKTLKQNAMGFYTLQHHLTVTDLLVTVQVACQNTPDINVASVERESTLQRIVAKQRKTERRAGEWIISDGAFTLSYPRLDVAWTYHIEVVRAGVRSGNKTLVEKMKRYARLHHQGYFDKIMSNSFFASFVV